MKTTSLKSIYLTKKELKNAIINYVKTNGNEKLANHLEKSKCEMDWSQSREEFIISVDDEFEDEESPTWRETIGHSLKRLAEYEKDSDSATILLNAAKMLIKQKLQK